MKKNIAIIAGGYSSELIVSLKSVETIYENLSKEKYNSYVVIINTEGWNVRLNEALLPINKNDFSFIKDGQKINFDCVYPTIHGTPGEDGKLQGYFDMIGLPYNSSSQKSSALTFDKWLCNQVLQNNGVNCSKSILLNDRSGIYNTKEIVNELGLPCFVKPNDGGSSFGISKVKEAKQLIPSINRAFTEGNEVILESFLDGTEITCACYKVNDKIEALPIVEIISETEFFDYEAKYEGLSQEICPARIEDSIRDEVQELTKSIYQILGLKGLIRVDYILVNNKPFVIEVNTAPGMSKESLVPKMVKEQKGLDLTSLFDKMIQETLTQ
ncbi:D-alanine--D-alanine ligase [Flavobacteriales bacterium]|nr:D-alanine--D-alanine ligase [Flavobacteriales bacterium]